MPHGINYNPMTGDDWSQNPFEDLETAWLFHQHDNFVNGGALYQGLNPGESQYSEYSQQMVATMYQNWYNSAPNQMKRALAAGINPFVAASGIVGADTGNVASAPNGVNNKAPDFLSAAGSALGALGSTFGSVSSGVVQLSKLKHEINNIDAETANIFEQMGFTHLQSIAISKQLKYIDAKEQLGVWQALATFEKTKAEYGNLYAQHRNILAQYSEIIANKDLLIAQKGEVEARKLLDDALASQANENARWQKLENDFFIAHGYKLGTPIYEALRDQMVSDGTFDLESFGNEVSQYEGKITSAVESAKASASWNYRPSNVTEAAAYIGQHVGEALRNVLLNSNGVSSWNELKTKVYANRQAKEEFEQGFMDAKEDLYENYLSKKRYYRNIKRGGNLQEVARALNDMNNAKAEYDNFTIDKFGNELMSQLYQKAVAPAE